MNNKFNELSIELTRKCLLNCVYCSSEAGVDKEEKLEFDRLLELINEVKKFGVNTISLSGGELFLYPEYLQFFNYLRDNDMKIIIYTSGIKYENGKRKPIPKTVLRKLKINDENPQIHVNIQGHNKEIIEKINGVPNSLNLIKKTIKNIRDEKLFLGANVVPFKENFRYIDKIYNFCLTQNFKQINFLRFVPQGRAIAGDFDLNKFEFMGLQKNLIKLLKRNQKNHEPINIRLGHPINFLFLFGQENLYKDGKSHYCRGGVDAPLIQPNGDVAMCPAWKNLTHFSAGNIYKQSFSEIWNSKNFKLFREFTSKTYKEKLSKPCINCNYLEECRGKCVAQRLLAHGDVSCVRSLEEQILYAPDPECFKI